MSLFLGTKLFKVALSFASSAYLHIKVLYNNIEPNISINNVILLNNEPLYVIDGVPVASGDYTYFMSTGNVLASLNSSTEETMGNMILIDLFFAAVKMA